MSKRNKTKEAVSFPVLNLEGSIVASDRKALELTADSFAQARTKATQAQAWAFYLVPANGGPKSSHQIKETGYAESCCIMLPSRETYALTGNPYPNVTTDKANEPSSPRYSHYKQIVLVSHVAFNWLAKSGDSGVTASGLFNNAEFRAEVDALLGKVLSWGSDTKNNHVLDAITHTLRELEVCNGFAVPSDTKRNRYTVWKYQPNLASLN